MFSKWTDLDYSRFSELGVVFLEFTKLGPVVGKVPSSSHGHAQTPGAYLLIHFESQKVYVGSHSNLYARPYQHHSLLTKKEHWNPEFQKAFNDDPNVVMAFIITKDREEGYDLEQNILDTFWDSGVLFNVAKNARFAQKDMGVSQATRDKLSAAGKGRPQSEEHKARRALALIGRKHSRETIQKIREKSLERGVSLNLVKAAALANSVAVYAAGVKYVSLVAAAKGNNCSTSCVFKRLSNRNYPLWYRVEDIHARPIIVKGVIYESIDAYSIAFGLNVDIIKTRVDSYNDSYSDWDYVDRV